MDLKINISETNLGGPEGAGGFANIMIDKLHGSDAGKNKDNTVQQDQKGFTGMINIGNFSGRQDAHINPNAIRPEPIERNSDAAATAAPQDERQQAQK